jgi:type IV secretion system protein VirB10
MDVYDSRTSRRLLLPKGALLSGAYNNDVRHGQSRLQFAFTRLRMPDGATFDLPGATGSDAAGQAGIDGDVDRHFFRSFGAALLLGVLADQVTRVAALPNGGTSGQGGVSATGQVFIDTARAELERHKSIPPTVTVEEGSRINVEVVRDMAFDTAFERNRR